MAAASLASAASTSASASLKVGFIGAGKMASALARGFLEGGAVASANQIHASCPRDDKHLLESMEGFGCQTTHCNKSLVDSSDVVLLAVKPNLIGPVLDEIKPVLKQKQQKDEKQQKNILISIAAGVTLDQMQHRMGGQDSKLVRLMPNTPCVVRQGASVFSRGLHSGPEDVEVVKGLLNSVGECHEVPENLIDAITGISGCGPAYMYLIMEAMADGAVKQGLPRALAYKLAAQTMVGAGKMVLDTQQHPAVLKDEVCSPGGATIVGLDRLEKNGLRTAIMQAVEAATVRCQELKEAASSSSSRA